MPGEIKIVIRGDPTKLEENLEQTQKELDETKKESALSHKEILTRDSVVRASVQDTTHMSRAELADLQATTTATLNILRRREARFQADWKRNLIETEMKLKQLNAQIKALDAEVDRVETKSRITVSNALIGLRAITDIAALVSISTGEQIDVHFLAMISMGLSAAMQIQTMAAVYAVTPGMQPVALMLLSMIPVLTGMIGFMKSEQMRVQATVDKRINSNFDSLIDGVRT